MANDGSLDLDIDIVAMRREAEGEPVVEAPAVPREQSLSVTYTSPDGDVQKFELVSRVLDSKGRLIYDRVLSRMVAAVGVSWQFLAAETQLALRSRARLSAQLVDPPDWLLSACLADDDLLYSIAGALGVHEDRYFRRYPAPGSATAPKPRVVVDAVDAA